MHCWNSVPDVFSDFFSVSELSLVTASTVGLLMYIISSRFENTAKFYQLFVVTLLNYSSTVVLSAFGWPRTLLSPFNWHTNTIVSLWLTQTFLSPFDWPEALLSPLIDTNMIIWLIGIDINCLYTASSLNHTSWNQFPWVALPYFHSYKSAWLVSPLEKTLLFLENVCSFRGKVVSYCRKDFISKKGFALCCAFCK